MKKKFHLNGKEKAAMLLFGLCVAGSPAFFSSNPELYKASILQEKPSTAESIFSPAQELEKMLINGEKEKMLEDFANYKNAATFLEDAYHWNTVDEVKTFAVENGFYLSVLGAKEDRFQPYFGFFDTKKNEIVWGEHGSAKIQSAAETEDDFLQVVAKNTGDCPWIVRSDWRNKATDEAVEMISQKEVITTNEEVVLLMKKSDNILLSNADIGFDVIFE